MTSLSLSAGIADLNFNSSGTNYNTYRIQLLTDSTAVISVNNGGEALASRTFVELFRISPTGGLTLARTLRMASGTTTMPPIIIPSGSLLSTEVLGALESDGTRLSFTGASVGRRMILTTPISNWATNRVPYYASGNSLASSANLTYNGTVFAVLSSSAADVSLVNALAASHTGPTSVSMTVGRTATNSVALFFDGSVGGIRNNNAASYYLGMNSAGNVIANTTIQPYSISPFYYASVSLTVGQWVNLGAVIFATNQQSEVVVMTRSGITNIHCRNIAGVVSGSFYSFQGSNISAAGLDASGNLFVQINTTQTQIDLYVRTSGLWLPNLVYAGEVTPTLSVTFTSQFALPVVNSNTVNSNAFRLNTSGSSGPLLSLDTSLNSSAMLITGTNTQVVWDSTTTTAIPSVGNNGGTGSRVVLLNSSSTVPYAIGVAPSSTWFSVPSASESFSFYSGTSVTTQITGGSIVTTGDVTAFGSISDKRLKRDIEDLESTEDAIMHLRPVSFRWRDDIFNESKRSTFDTGFIAQEVSEIIPEVMTEMKIGDVDYKGIKYEKLVPYLVKQIQDLTMRVRQLESQQYKLSC